MKLILTFLLLVLIGCTKPDEWTAFVYPDIDNIPGPEKSEAYVIAKFETFDACQAAAVGQVRTNLDLTDTQGAYVCGRNCSNRKDFGNLLVCEEKRK